MTVGIAEHVRRFGLTPKVALLADSDFGGSDSPSALKMRAAVEMVHAWRTDDRGRVDAS
jgi:malate dehydrogenase (oxaloacetate-decarboxylating)(NADP+)